MEYLKMEDIVEVKDLNLAAALMTASHKLEAFDDRNKNEVYFIFKNSMDLQETIDNYWTGNLNLNIGFFQYNQKRLKEKVFSLK